MPLVDDFVFAWKVLFAACSREPTGPVHWFITPKRELLRVARRGSLNGPHHLLRSLRSIALTTHDIFGFPGLRRNAVVGSHIIFSIPFSVDSSVEAVKHPAKHATIMKPPGISDQFWDDELYDGCENISERHHLNLDQHGEMDAAVRDLVEGFCGTGNFVQHLCDRINNSANDEDDGPTISEATAEKIAADIKREVLAPIRDILVGKNPTWQAWLEARS